MKDLVTVRIESSAFDTDSVRIVELTGTETISRMFEITLRVVTLDGAALDEDKLLTSAVELVFDRTDDATHVVTEERRIGGMLSSVRDRFLTETQHHEAVVTFVPKAWKTTLTHTTDIFMDMTIPEIIQKKLETGAGMVGPEVEMRLKETYPKREFLVQYKESDHDFICRLTEDQGIHFFFERTKDKDVMVFADENAAFKPSLPENAPFHKRGESIGVFQLEATRRRVTRNFTARDYNWRNPSMDLLGEAKAQLVGADGLADNFGPHAKDNVEVARYAQLRAEEAIARYQTYEADSDLPGLRAGSVVKIEGHALGDLELVVVEVRHHAKQAVFGAAAGDAGYKNSFKAIQKAVTYRAPLLTPKPIVHGVVTGVVQSGSPTDFGAIDEEGRYRVEFMYDTVSGREEGKASRPIRMAQPSAGAGRGFHQPLKPGTEVMIICLNGDPDRPLIVGAVPNPQTPSPVTSSNSEKSTWKTNLNQVEMDDREARFNLTVDNSKFIIQVGAPHAPELGVYTSSDENITTKAKKVYTTVTKMKNAFAFSKLGTASADIVGAAGIPNPLSTWDTVVNAVQATAEFASALGGFIDGAEELYKGLKTDAGKAKKKANEDFNKAREEVYAEMAKRAEKNPKVLAARDKKDNPVNPRYETADEAKARGYDEELQDPANRDQADKLNEAAHDAAQADKEFDETLYHVGADADEIIGEGKKAYEKAEGIVKDVKEYAGYAKQGIDFLANNETAKKIGSALNDGLYTVQSAVKMGKAAQEKLKKALENPKVKALVSKLSGIFSKATVKTAEATVTATQKSFHAVPVASGQRKGSNVGDFASPHNIQLSRHSAVLYGARNAFVFGGKNATFASVSSTSILAKSRVDVKSTKEIEIASKEVFVSAKQDFDLWARKHAKLVAHTARNVEMPGGFSMLLHAKESLKGESTDKDIELKAKKNVKVEAVEENFEVKAKKMIKAQADKNVDVLTKEGMISLRAEKGAFTMMCKTNAQVKSSDGDVTINAEKGKGTIKAKTDLKLDCADGTWKASGDVNVKASNVKLKGSKIHLG